MKEKRRSFILVFPFKSFSCCSTLYGSGQALGLDMIKLTDPVAFCDKESFASLPIILLETSSVSLTLSPSLFLSAMFDTTVLLQPLVP